MKIVIAALAMLLMLGACAEEASPEAAKREANPEKYAKDRDSCRIQVDEYMQTRRTIDDSRRDVYVGERERYGQTTLPSQMDGYGDSRNADRYMARCMEARGWPQPQKKWWQRIGS